MLLHLVAAKPTDSVTLGFLPAAARLGLEVTVLTDQPEAHERAYAGQAQGETAPAGIVRCDVWDMRALIAAMAGLPRPDAVFSNSDHLQVQTALAAEYFGLPGKDWRFALRARNKALMRRRLAETGRERVAATEIRRGAEPPAGQLGYPLVLKPSEGVASEDVVLVSDPGEFSARCAEIMSRRPGERLIAEEYLPGTLRTLETLSDGATTWVLGGFRTRVSPPPFFIEERLSWDVTLPVGARRHVLAALRDLGGPFGACHTELMLDAEGGPRLVEVNDRVIGDHGDFVLADLLGIPLFERILRVHLGERLPATAPQASGHAVADYVVADRSGMLASAPRPGSHPVGEPGVRLTYHPLRPVGDHFTLTHANRDYLGVIRAQGPDPAAVERAVGSFRARGHWDILATGAGPSGPGPQGSPAIGSPGGIPPGDAPAGGSGGREARETSAPLAMPLRGGLGGREASAPLASTAPGKALPRVGPCPPRPEQRESR